MKIPNFKALKTQDVSTGLCHSYAQMLHPNPKFYKYIWWVFWRKSPCDGLEFLVETNALGTANAFMLRQKLFLLQECHWIYNRRLPRDEPGVTPFSRTSTRWREVQFAPSYEDDNAHDWEGHR